MGASSSLAAETASMMMMHDFWTMHLDDEAKTAKHMKHTCIGTGQAMLGLME